MILNGIIDAAVMGGIAKYEEVCTAAPSPPPPKKKIVLLMYYCMCLISVISPVVMVGVGKCKV